ncbi:hypothetical protein BCR44DRAFT_1511592 [Catenaria anguillulae PL171]|uniref:Armadillo-type protein n=1 Tax=Catenaria anguillulae PL171 TaxID=765915 RepID=A0A1Y2HXM6_9FUNG|nr:hypothetical protein BCR44DRAFT_1511592 [Catenaria anguillulae PL171]
MTTRSKAKSQSAAAAAAAKPNPSAQAQARTRTHTRTHPDPTAKDDSANEDDDNDDSSSTQHQESLWSLPSQSQQLQHPQHRPGQPRRLDFTLSIVPRSATKDKAIPASDLVKRLKTLNDALKALPQEATDTQSCDKVAQDLIHASVLHHRDRGVKILVACCLSEILRLYAPEAPYDDDQLKDIFDLFANQFQHLNQLDNNPYHAFYLQLLASLVAVRSICIVADLDTAEDLTLLFFSHLLTKLQPQHPPHVHKHAADLLITLIAECPTIPLEAVDLLLDAAVPSSSLSHDHANSDASSPADDSPGPVAQSFMDTLLTAAKAVHQRTTSATQALAASTQAHARMSALYPLSPKMLLNVIPQLEEELVAEHVPFRELALRTLAAMAQLPSMHALAVAGTCPGVYNAHAHGEAVAGDLNAALVKLLLDPDEKLDFDVVRKTASAAVWDALGSRIRDKRASVRLAAVKAAGYVWRRVMHVVLPSKAVPAATDTQAAAAAAAARQATADSQRIEPPTQSFQVHHTNLDADEINKLMATFAWCPRDLLGSAYLNDPELTAILENLLIESVVHPKEPGQATGNKNAGGMGASEWELATDRLLWFLSAILDDDHAKRAFVAVLKRQSVTATETLALLDLAKQYAALEGTQQRGDLQLRINRIIQAMAARLPDAPRAEQALNAFVKAYDPSWGAALTSLSQWSDRDFAQVKRTAKDVLRTMEAAMPGSMQVLGIVARRMAPFIVSHEMVPGLIGRISIAAAAGAMAENDDDEEEDNGGGEEGGWAARLRATAMWVLDVLAREFPDVVAKYAGHVLQVLDSVLDRAAVLNVLARVECKDLTTRQMDRLKGLAEDYPLLAPAIGALLARGNHVGACEDLVMYAADQVISQDTNAEIAAGALGMLAKIVKHQVHTYEDMPQGVDRVTARTVWWLMREYSAVDMGGAGALDARTWVEPGERPAETRAQVAAIKLLTNRVVALGNGASTHDLARQALVPLVSLLDKVLSTRGTLDLADLPEFAASTLRLVAGRAVLKLARTRSLADRIPEHLYLHTAMLIEDPVQQVRVQMLAKVRGLLALMQVSARWVPLVALAANDPDDLTKQSAAALLKGMAHNPTLARGVELALPRLVHVVAHLVPPGAVLEGVSASATASAAAAAIKTVAAPIELYLDAVMRAESVATLFHVLVKIKEHKAKHPVAMHELPTAAHEADADLGDGSSQADRLATGINTNAYALAEYATKYLRDRCKLHGWPIATVPKATDLPRDLYVALDRTEAVANTKKTYLAPAVTASALAAAAAAGGGARKSATKRTRKQSAGGDADEGEDEEADSDKGSAPTTPAKAKAKVKRPVRPARPAGKASATKRRKTSKDGDDHDDDDEVDEDVNGGEPERRKSGRVQRKSYHEPGSDDEDAMDVDGEEEPERRSPAAKKAKKAAAAAEEESGSDTE